MCISGFLIVIDLLACADINILRCTYDGRVNIH